jgi:hypothetical protein
MSYESSESSIEADDEAEILDSRFFHTSFLTEP